MIYIRHILKIFIYLLIYSFIYLIIMGHFAKLHFANFFESMWRITYIIHIVQIFMMIIHKLCRNASHSIIFSKKLYVLFYLMF